MVFEGLDGYYDATARKSYALTERPQVLTVEPIALKVEEIRAVHEGCWVARAIAFARYKGSKDELSARQRALFRDDLPTARNLRRTYENLTPSVLRYFAEMPARTGRCAARDQVLAAAHASLKGKGAEQLRAAARFLAPAAKARPTTDNT